MEEKVEFVPELPLKPAPLPPLPTVIVNAWSVTVKSTAPLVK
jgi:hypothetical protein